MPHQILLLPAVPNSNPNSAFSHFEILSVQEHNLAPVTYELFGIKENEVVRIAALHDFEQAKNLLVDLNGPLPESDEEE